MMNHTEKQFLFNCGEHNWTDTWFDIFPEEIIQIIYKYVNPIYTDILPVFLLHETKKTLYSRWKRPYVNWDWMGKYSTRLKQDTYQLLKLKDNNWDTEPSYYIQKTIGYDNGFELLHEETLHDFKMSVAVCGNQRYTDFEVNWEIERGNSAVHYPKFINYEGFKFRQAVIQYYNEIDIDHKKLFCFGITYVNENLGKIEIRSKTFDRSLTNKKSKRFIKYPEDFLSPRVTIYDKHITYYNSFKTK